MALIDKDQLKSEIDKRYAEYRAKMKTDDFTYYEGMADALDLFEQFLDTLPEHPSLPAGLEEEIEEWWQNWASPPRNEFAVFNKKEFINLARHFAEWGAEHLKK